MLYYLRPFYQKSDVMSVLAELETRSESKCELCSSDKELFTYLVPPKVEELIENQIAICKICLDQIENEDTIDADHWRCINESMWSQISAVQVMSYRMLQKLSQKAWAQDLLAMMYMDDTTTEWANALDASSEALVHKDSNGNILENGDTVVLIKDLNVKGAGFVAKRGTSVRRISLVADNPEHIQGRINDQTIIILTQFVKK